ncbi:RHS repeat domain-containing protein [Pseudomonas sp.]|uniref:RHS repeat domain-containing protein n=1 Tax=Pseudomonas sp. TaxID=306 RepID=UPI001B2CA691|nr:RHS repeat domain-containing protein [Pseudomonas sp.]MBO9549831.1 RHS repeat protein [Pseudomonas sp.]
MSIDKTLHSTAFSFMSFIQGGVDRRTGLCTMSIAIPDLKSHALAGPSFRLGLNYNPLNTADSGFGRGWNLGLTQYTPHNQVLSLSTGESFRLEDSDRADKRLLIPEQKIPSFHVYKEGNAGLGATRRLRVVHRSGLKEILELQGAGNSIGLPVSILNMGFKLQLDYVPFGSRHTLLSSISEVDEEGALTRLLTVERTSSAVQILEHSVAAGVVLRYVMGLSGSDYRVSQITLPTANAANWEFEYQYDPSNTYLSVTQVRTPTGAKEVFEYTDGGHRFPSAAQRVSLPRVNRHKTFPGTDLPNLGIRHALVDVGFEYQNTEAQGWGTNNFLGDDSTPWGEDDGLDNLYKRNGAYLYGSLETHYVEGEPVRVIERRFNRFHLLAAEITRQGNSQQEALNTYPLDEEKPFDQQPASFQLPTEELQRWLLRDNTRPPRTQVVQNRYDNHGNLVWRKRVDDVEEEHLWYPEQGEAGACPPDPEGFVRHLKQTTVKPAPTGSGQAPTLSTLRTYISLSAVTDREYDANDPDHAWRAYGGHVVEGETLGDGRQALEWTNFTYYEDPGDPVRHGRVKERELNYPTSDPEAVLSTSTFYSYEIVRDDISDEDALETVERLVGFDDESKTITSLHSLLHGEPLLNHDDNDVRIRYGYDALRRVTFETVDPAGDNEATKKYEYHLCAHAADVAEQVVFDVKNVRTRSILDGFNRVLYEERDDNDSKLYAGAPRPTFRASYDALRQEASRTEIDWHEAWVLELESRFEHDDWGQQSCEIGPDGSRDYTVIDPLGALDHRGPIITAWRVGSDGGVGGRTQTWMNLFDEPVRVERYYEEQDEAGRTVQRRVSLKQLDYDGLGRLHRERDGEGVTARINLYGYDAFDRLLDHTLPGNAIVQRTYAAHSREDWPVSIKVGSVLLGEQTFDGLGRRTHAITGYRDQEFRYRPGERQPYLMIAPDKREVTYQYLPAVGEEPVQRLLANVEARYFYDPKNARLNEFEEPGHRVERKYFTQGDLKQEDRYIDGEHYTMHYGYSFRSRMHFYVDVLQQRQAYVYDRFGRLEQTRLHEAISGRRRRAGEPGPELLRSDFAYDEFGRTKRFTTRDVRSASQLVTALEYDGFDRETVRSFDFGGDTLQILTQCYDQFDCIQQRVLLECDREAFEALSACLQACGEEMCGDLLACLDACGAPYRLLRDESYGYDLRGRLTRYTCNAFESEDDPDNHYWPVDPYGKKIQGQTFSFDDLDNITLVLTTFEGGFNRARYFFGDPVKRQDPAQLLQITNTHADYPPVINLEYDPNGNLTKDDAGRTLLYDALNRLTQVTLVATSANAPGEHVEYQYDAQNILSGTRPVEARS